MYGSRLKDPEFIDIMFELGFCLFVCTIICSPKSTRFFTDLPFVFNSTSNSLRRKSFWLGVSPSCFKTRLTVLSSGPSAGVKTKSPIVSPSVLTTIPLSSPNCKVNSPPPKAFCCSVYASNSSLVTCLPSILNVSEKD